MTQTIRKCLTDSERTFKTQGGFDVVKGTVILNAYSTEEKRIFISAKRFKCKMANSSFMALMRVIRETRKSK